MTDANSLSNLVKKTTILSFFEFDVKKKVKRASDVSFFLNKMSA